MKTKKFYVMCNGNFSHDYGWDSGLNVNDVVLLNKDDEFAHDEYARNNSDFAEVIPEKGENGDISVVFRNEHGGSRVIDLVVFATTENRAKRYSRVWANAYYPAY